ncbi:MAG: histidine phosphatase family protein [Eubacterium sp.]|nr:histidine phosphatase family protein [Eubacterium sp.]
MKVYIIRHGETSWNTEYRMQGRTDIELNENGVKLAELTAEGLKDVPFDACFSSPLKRAVHTAQIILGDRDVRIQTDPRLYEIDFGVWEGLSLDPAHPDVERPKFLSSGAEAFAYVPPEGGESLQDVVDRTADFYREMTANPKLQDKTILIVAHGTPCRALLYEACEDKSDFWRGRVPANCAVSILNIQDGRAEMEVMDRIFYPQSWLKDFYSVKKSAGEDSHEDQ